jgi:hypothetical protein
MIGPSSSHGLCRTPSIKPEAGMFIWFKGKTNNRIVSVIFRGVKFTFLATALPGSCLGFKHAVGVALVTLYPTPSTYTIAARTVTLISAATACAATTTSLAPGTQTVGAVTLLFPVPPPSPCHMPVSGRNREPSPVRFIRPRFSVRPPALTQLVQPRSYRINDLCLPGPCLLHPRHLHSSWGCSNNYRDIRPCWLSIRPFHA